MAPPKTPILDRLADYFEITESGCYEWTAGKTGNGYGAVWVNGQTIGAHVAVYEATVEPISHGMQIDHLCLNKKCINPDHLEIVTQAENTRRHHAAITHCPNGHPYDETNTYIYPGTNKRKCRACRRLS